MKGQTKHLIRTFLLLSLLFGPPYFLVHSTWVHRTLLGMATRAAGIPFTFEKSRLSLLLGRLILQEVVSDDPQERFHFSASGISLSISPLSLIRGRLVISHLDVNNGNFILKKSPSLKSSPTEDWREALFRILEGSFLLQNLAIQDASFHLLKIEIPSGSSWRADRLSLSLGNTLGRGLQVKVRGSHLTERDHLLVEQLRLETTLARKGLTLHTLEMQRPSFSLKLQGNWKGDLKKGFLEAKGEVFPYKVLDRPLTFEIAADLKDSIAQIKKITASLEGATLNALGAFHFKSRHYALDFQASDLPLEAIFHKLPSRVLGPARGMVELSGTAEGTLPTLAARGKATISDFRHGRLAASQAKGEIQFLWPELSFNAEIESGKNSGPNGQVQGAVAFKPLSSGGKIVAQPQKIVIAFNGAPLEELVPAAEIKGKLSGRLDFEGVGTRVRGEGQARLEKGSVGSVKIESLETRVSVREDGIFFFRNSNLELTGLESISLPQTLEIEPEGSLVRFSGNPSPRLTIQGEYDLSQKGLRIDRLDVRSEAGTLQIAGTAQEALDLKIHGPLELSSLQTLREIFTEASGLADLDLAIGGSLEDPTFSGDVSIRNTLFEIRHLGETFHKVSGKVRLEGDLLYPDLSGRLGDGNFSLKGLVALSQRRPRLFDLHLVGSGLPFQSDRTLTGEVNCEVSLKGEVPNPLLSGRVDIIRARYAKEFAIEEFVLSPLVSKKDIRPKESLLDPIRLDLRLKSAGDLEVRNNIALILFSADLGAKGTIGSPEYEGALTLIQGTFQYGSAQFEMTEGQMEFVKPFQAEPTLILLGEREVPPDYLINLRIEGPLSNLAIHLTSSPSLAKNDIVSLLAFGLTQKDLEKSGGLGRAITGQIAWAGATRPLQQAFSRSTGFNVQLEPSRSGDLSPKKFRLEGAVTDRLSFELKSDFSPETAEQTLQANYYLTDSVLLKGFRTQAASTAPRYQFNLSLRFQIR